MSLFVTVFSDCLDVGSIENQAHPVVFNIDYCAQLLMLPQQGCVCLSAQERSHAWHKVPQGYTLDP